MTEKRTSTRGSADGLTAEEKAALKETLRERKAAKSSQDAEADVLAKIAEMPAADRSMAERIHAAIRANAPYLSPRTWYGMPAYTRDGKVVCFFQSADKFKARYATFGFNDEAKLDDGSMWPTSFALTRLTDASLKQIVALVKKA